MRSEMVLDSEEQHLKICSTDNSTEWDYVATPNSLGKYTF